MGRGRVHEVKPPGYVPRKGDPIWNPNDNPDVLEGLHSISEFLGKSVNTTAGWIKNHGLPATKTPEGKWMTHKEIIYRWIIAGHRAEMSLKDGSPFRGLQMEGDDE